MRGQTVSLEVEKHLELREILHKVPSYKAWRGRLGIALVPPRDMEAIRILEKAKVLHEEYLVRFPEVGL